MAGRGRRERTGGGSVDDRRRRAERRARAERRTADRRWRERRRADRRLRTDRRGDPRTAPGVGPARHDARSGRGERTRAHLLDAVLDGVARRRAVPGMVEVARTTGITPRSVHYHFPTHHDLVVAAAALQQRRTRHWLFPADPGAPLEIRVGHTVASRQALHGALGTLHLAVATHPAGQGLAEPVLVEHRTRLRDQLAVTFAAELGAVPADGAVLLDALDTVAGEPGWWPRTPAGDRARMLLLLARPDVSRGGVGPAR